MRLLIALLLVAAIGTSIVAYGPKLSLIDRALDELDPQVGGIEEEGLSEFGEPTPKPKTAPEVDIASIPDGEVIPGTEGLRRVSAPIRRSLNHTLASKLERSVADPLTQVVSRTLVWWMNPGRDLQPNDQITIIYSLHDGEEPRLHAVSMTSQRHGRTFSAYAYHSEDSKYRRIYTEDGEEVEKRLVGSPVEDYEQITSLLWDGRRHNGVDFKTPVGTKTYVPFDGRVIRINWNTRFNGNCMEIQIEGGRRILFLHLDSFADGIKPGVRVRKGDLVALSGNTGRSTAPHLHYELRSSSDRVLDPFDIHDTYRVRLPKTEMKAFEEHLEMLRALMVPAEPAEVYAADG